jgi:hypothetical protein
LKWAPFSGAAWAFVIPLNYLRFILGSRVGHVLGEMMSLYQRTTWTAPDNRPEIDTHGGTKIRHDGYLPSRGAVMNKSYFDVILVSLVVAGCYLFIEPV